MLLVIYNVISEPMHALVRDQLHGSCLPATARRDHHRGCSYWLPPSPTLRALHHLDMHKLTHSLPPFRLGLEVSREPEREA